MQMFEFRMSFDQEVERLYLAAGEMGGEASGGAFDYEHIQTPHLERRGFRTIDWQIASFLDGGSASTIYRRRFRGTLFAGRSLRLRAGALPSISFRREETGRRKDQNDFFSVARNLDWPVEGDIAFLGLRNFIFEPDGPVRELEVELRGSHYDGAQVQWEVGGGISTIPPITGGAGAGEDKHVVIAWPTFGAVLRKAVFASSQLMIQHLRFTGSVGFVASIPRQFGAIHNVGNIPTLITSLQRVGPHPGEFDIRLEYRGVVFSMFDLPGRVPLILAPGETLLIGGRFFPQAEAGPNDPPRSVFLDFQTNNLQTPVARVEVVGRTEPQNPVGALVPPAINFGYVPLTTGDSADTQRADRVFRAVAAACAIAGPGR
jgi:hypothetical protein